MLVSILFSLKRESLKIEGIEDRTDRAQKNRFGIRNGGGATTRKNNRKTGKTDGGKNFPVLSRRTVEQCTALHQRVFGLKHDAKLRYDYLGQLIRNVKFLLDIFFQYFFTLSFSVIGIR